MGLSAYYISKDSFNSLSMMYLWIMHKLAHLINREGDVRLGERKVLERSVQSGN